MPGILFGSFSLWGWNGVWFVALQDLTPVCPDVWCPLFLSSCSVVASAPFSLFFFLSQVLGKPKPPSGVWDSPCVSSSRPRSPSWTRTPCSTTTPRLRSRHCLFFLSSSSFAGLVVVGLGLSGLCLVGVHVRCLLHVMNVVREGERHKTCRPPLLSLRFSRFFFFWGPGVRGCPGGPPA